MTEFIIQIISSATVSAAVCGVLVWLFQLWISERLKGAIKAEYDQKLETHKAQLRAQSDIEIEKLRSQLSMAATEHQIRFSGLHDKRAEVVAKTYALLQRLYDTLGSYVNIVEFSGTLSRDERRQEAIDAHKAFIEYYPNHLIFLPKSTAEKINLINRLLVNTYNDFYLTIDRPIGSGDSSKWLEIYQRVGGEVKAALDGLEDEFRRLLGDG
jgi:hypothetical protein